MAPQVVGGPELVSSKVLGLFHTLTVVTLQSEIPTENNVQLPQCCFIHTGESDCLEKNKKRSEFRVSEIYGPERDHLT